MKKTDAQALKAKHRLELVMQEWGEQFDIEGDQWRSKTTPYLVVNIRLQTFQSKKPGMDEVTGDLYDWLMMRCNWTFKQALRYLQKRPFDPDPDLAPETQPQKAEERVAHLAKHEWKFESEHPDEEKEASGLYDWGLVDRGDGKPFYQYLLNPIDQWQQRALEIAGEKVRECFTWDSWEIEALRRSQPSRFIPVIDMDVDRCNECGKELSWWWKQKPQYAHVEVPFNGEIRFGTSFKKMQIYDNQQVYAFEYEMYDETFCICEDCMRMKINYRQALSLLYKSARNRKATNCLMQKEGGS